MLRSLFLFEVNKRLARDSNAASRRMLVQILEHMNKLALAWWRAAHTYRRNECCSREARWGYSLHSNSGLAPLCVPGLKKIST